MSFQEEGHTLQEWIEYADDLDKDISFFDAGKVYDTELISKQLVREAFEEVELACEDDNYFAISSAIDKFKKRLGLEEKE